MKILLLAIAAILTVVIPQSEGVLLPTVHPVVTFARIVVTVHAVVDLERMDTIPIHTIPINTIPIHTIPTPIHTIPTSRSIPTASSTRTMSQLKQRTVGTTHPYTVGTTQMSELTPVEFVEKYGEVADELASFFHLDRNLFLAQFAIETGWGSSYEANTDLNLAGIMYNGIACTRGSYGFARFASLQNFATCYKNVLNLPYYTNVRAQSGKPFDSQAVALGESPWAASHYNDGGGPGSLLISVEKLLPNTSTPTVTPTTLKTSSAPPVDNDTPIINAAVTESIDRTKTTVDDAIKNAINTYDQNIQSTYTTRSFVSELFKSLQVDLDHLRTSFSEFVTATNNEFDSYNKRLNDTNASVNNSVSQVRSEIANDWAQLSTSDATTLAELQAILTIQYITTSQPNQTIIFTNSLPYDIRVSILCVTTNVGTTIDVPANGNATFTDANAGDHLRLVSVDPFTAR